MVDIKLMFQDILNEQESSATIIEIFKTGSQLFKDDPNDLDYVAVCENYEDRYYREHVEVEDRTYDLIIKDKDEFVNLLSFDDKNADIGYRMNILYNYFLSIRETVWGNWNFTWDILENKNKYLKYLKKQYAETIGKRIVNYKLTKSWVHYYVVLKIFENDSVEITPEMKEDILLLYNSTTGDQLPVIDWIESKLYEVE